MALAWSVRCACWALVSSLLAAVLLNYCSSSHGHLANRVVAGAVAIVLLLSSLIAFHISTLRCSESHTLTSLLLSYKWHQVERMTASHTLEKNNRMWRHPRGAQEDLIRELTRRQAKTEYGRKNRLEEIRSLEDLRKKHPLTTYDHFKDYIQRLADGEEGAFLGERLVRFGITSGTTGAGKLIPYSRFLLDEEARCTEVRRFFLYEATHHPSPVQKRCFLYTHPKTPYSKSGLIIAPYALIRQTEKMVMAELSSPPPAFTITHEPSAVYVHMLFAIADPNLALIFSMFTPHVYRALACLEANWRAMLVDLSTGRINAEIPLDPEVRRALQAYIRPDPARVSELRREFEKGFHNIVKRVWPHILAIEGIDTSGFRQRIKEKYNSDVPCFSWGYGGTEAAVMSNNIWIHEQESRYVFMPNKAVYEFIPEENSTEEDPKTLLLDEVEVGGKYELVLTTRTGLYRYRNGDVIQIVGFHEKCPVMIMLYRTGENFNLIYEKMNPVILDAAVRAMVRNWSEVELTEWTCAESPVYDPENSELFYMVFIEVSPGEKVMKITEGEKLKFDKDLQQAQVYYGGLRGSGTICPAQLHLVRPGAFQELRDFILSNSTASVNQYKTPRKLKKRDLVVRMMERIVEGNKDTK